MSGPVVIDLPYPPTENHRLKGNHRIKERVKQWRTDAGWLVKIQRPEKITGPYRFKLLAKRPDNRKRDISNLIKETLDLVVRMGIAPDDHLAEVDGAYWCDAIPDGCRVILTPVEA